MILTETKIEKPTLQKVIETSRIRALMTQLPIIAGCEDAERLSFQFALTYDAAHMDGTPFDCTDEDISLPGKRLSIVDPSRHNPYYPDKAKIGFYRLIIAEFRSYLEKNRISVSKMQDVINEFGGIAQQQDEEIDNIFTYKQAITAKFWWI